MLRRNLLVLGIHLCACWIGAIIGRPHQPAPARWGRAAALHRPVPDWMARLSLYYALAVTLLSVAVQAFGLGEQLASISAAAGLGSTHLLLLVLPHAVPELVAVFLPLGLFLLEARRARLDRLGPWSMQAAGLALPLLVAAAVIETYVTPGAHPRRAPSVATAPANSPAAFIGYIDQSTRLLVLDLSIVRRDHLPMFNRRDYSTAFDVNQDRDLIAQINEARDPAQLDSLALTARTRLRDRHRRSTQPERRRHSSARRPAFPRALMPRH